MDVNHGKFGRRRLKDVAVVMELHEFAPVGRRFHGQAALGVSAAAAVSRGLAEARAGKRTSVGPDLEADAALADELQD